MPRGRAFGVDARVEEEFAMSDETSLFNTGRYVSLCPSLQRDLDELDKSWAYAEALNLLYEHAGLSEEEYLKLRTTGNE